MKLTKTQWQKVRCFHKNQYNPEQARNRLLEMPIEDIIREIPELREYIDQIIDKFAEGLAIRRFREQQNKEVSVKREPGHFEQLSLERNADKRQWKAQMERADDIEYFITNKKLTSQMKYKDFLLIETQVRPMKKRGRRWIYAWQIKKFGHEKPIHTIEMSRRPGAAETKAGFLACLTWIESNRKCSKCGEWKPAFINDCCVDCVMNEWQKHLGLLNCGDTVGTKMIMKEVKKRKLI